MFARLFVLHDRAGPQGPAYLAELGTALPVSSLRWGEEAALADAPDQPWLIDFETLSPAKAKFLRSKRGEAGSTPRFFVVPPRDRAAVVEARALGATVILDRPVDPIRLSRLLISLKKITAPLPTTTTVSVRGAENGTDAGAALAALQELTTVVDDLVDACVAGYTPRGDSLYTAVRNVLPAIDREGLGSWMALVRRHHTGIYEHSLITMTLAAAFGRTLHLGHEQEVQLAAAGLVHDIGKCWVPPEILAKPGSLTPDEYALVRRHSHDGWAALHPSIPALDAGVLDAVLHHHEYLDGSGYPDGLLAAHIPTITRMITITDIYAALAEARSYRRAMKPSEIRPVLEELAARGCIDAELWAAFPHAAAG